MQVKKYVFVALALCAVLIACNKAAFLKKLVGTWHINTYLFDGTDRTVYFDTTYREYTLDIAEDNLYTITWKTYTFTPDSVILTDTLGYDTANSVYILHHDTLRFVDTLITPGAQRGIWDLINSDEDLQLRDTTNGANDVNMYRVLELNKSNLKLRKGNEEFYYKN